MIEILNILFHGLTAFGAVAVVMQLYMMRRLAKYDTCHKLHQMFVGSEILSRFHHSLSAASSNEVTESEIIKALLDEAFGDPESYRVGAEAYASFLKYLYYNVQQHLVHPRDAVQIAGPVINEYYRLRDRIQLKVDKGNNKWRKFFPEQPRALAREMRHHFGGFGSMS
ncbi:MAG TPA: hypothetical protein VGG06_35535 [Thermoanaerobaculia bacterium]